MKCYCGSFFNQFTDEAGTVGCMLTCSDCAAIWQNKPLYESLKAKYSRKHPEREDWHEAIWSAFFNTLQKRGEL